MTKILVVDDNEQNLYLLKVLLESQGYELWMAKNGLEASEMMQKNIPDLIISDILMPGMDGFSFCRKCKASDRLKGVPFIFYTATYTDLKDEEFALSLGAERFVRKPTEPDKFIEIVRDILIQHKENKIVKPQNNNEKEEVFLKKYNEALVRKMEDKMLDLEQINQRLSALFQVSVDLTSLKPIEELIPDILNKAIHVLNCSHATYFEYDKKTNRFAFQSSIGFSEKDLSEPQRNRAHCWGEQQGLIESVGRTQEAIYIEDTDNDPRWIEKGNQIKSALFLPMVCEGNLIGVLCFLDTRTGSFGHNASRDMLILANNLAIAIDRMRFFEKIKQSERRYRMLIDNSIDAIISIDSDGMITDWSRGAEVVLGYARPEQIGTTIEALVPVQSRQEIKETLKEVRTKGYKRNWESQLLAKDGHLINVEMTCTYQGSELGYTTIIRDVTKQKEGERALRESEKFLNSIIENLPNMLFVKDAKELRFIQFNKAGEDLLGYSKQEMYGKNDRDFFPKDEADIFIQKDKEALKKNQFIDIPQERILTKSKEERILHTKKIPILDEQGTPKYLLGISEDITKRMRSEQLLNALNQVTLSMAIALTPEDIFTIVARELKKLDISCLLFPIENRKASIFTTYLRYRSLASDGLEKPAGVEYEEFSLPIDAIDVFKETVRRKRSIFVENTQTILNQIFPKYTDKVSGNFSKLLHIPKIIISPLIVEEQVIGIFFVQSKNLTQDDTPAITAFANQFAAAWNKAKLTFQLKQTMDGVVQTIASIVEMRDPYTAGHQNRVADLAAAIAKKMNLSEERTESVRIAGVIHDLGKIHIPAEILSKPGRLSDIEYDLVKTHPQMGYDLLKNIEFSWPLAEIVYQHHEKIDGSGYPRGLRGNKILLEARILTVADVVEAMSSHRPYRPALGIKTAIEEIVKNKGVLYDSNVVDACLKVLEQGYTL
ncbi:MAG TPA: hypothetical protein DCK95_07915 [Anaerolineaceae bacterium]|nr:hypothetical protein [Anaerolineaceae bacterium]